ncbi:hypothetical protein HDV00_004637 [Rhizophlyctis rosea]|nr:hypothetical protein HDV00_004637 [Rhizophlyctis rosea]
MPRKKLLWKTGLRLVAFWNVSELAELQCPVCVSNLLNGADNATIAPEDRRRENVNDTDVTWDYAVRASKCQDCNKSIPKGALKVHLPAHPDKMGDRTLKDLNLKPGWRHVKCFQEHGDYLTDQNVEAILEDESVKEDDKEEVRRVQAEIREEITARNRFLGFGVGE